MKKYQNNNGFGLLEVVIAISILIIVIGGSVAFSRMTLKNTVISLSRVQAYNLAQEGIEKLRYNRDNAWTDDNNATNFDSSVPLGTYENRDASNPIVIDNGMSQKKFTRSIVIANPDSQVSNLINNELGNPIGSNAVIRKVTVSVSWDEYNNTWNQTIVTYLTDWQPDF